MYGSITPSSLPFSNSYLQRSSGIEALYWNPANINNIPTRHELLFLPLGFRLENNIISLDLYNRTTGQFMDDDIKHEMLGSLNGFLMVGMNMNLINFGYMYDKWAFSMGTNMAARSNIDEQYIELMLFGNEMDREYVFTTANNNFAMLAYQDITFGYGGFVINTIHPDFFRNVPDINIGISVSALAGLATAESIDFIGTLWASDVEGFNMLQDVNMRYGVLGYGCKLAIGLSSVVYEFDEEHTLSAGLSFDNILGSIKWLENLEEHHYTVRADNVFMNKLEYDLIQDSQSTKSIDSFRSYLPLVFRFGTLYSYQDFTFSVDYAQNFGKNHAYYYDPEFSFGIEYLVGKWLPIQFGVRLPNGELLSAYSFGLGLRYDRFECGFGYQSIGSFFGDKTKGLSLSTQMKFRF
jgi:hypothetical protein